MNTQSNSWKKAAIIGAIAVPATLALGGGAIMLQQRSAPSAVAARPTAEVIENCNRYAAEARNNSRIVHDGLVGGAVGAGVGAAGGAIADGKDGIGKGAGIGALLGLTAGALYGLNQENQKSEQARHAYSECLARRG